MHGRAFSWLRLTVGLVSVVVLAAFSAVARADDNATMQAVLVSQLTELRHEQALNKCLAASPHKNTPCIVKKSLLLATAAGQQSAAITAAMDGTEAKCVRTVAQQEVAYLRLWRLGALALHNNQRKKAKALFVQSVPVAEAQRKLEPTCFTEVSAGGGHQ
jgi:hypothetical protein